MDIRLKAKRVHESYTRAGGAAMIPVFYDKLINASSEIKEKFDQVDMNAQSNFLAHAIVMSFLFVDPDHQVAARTINNVRLSHNHEHLNIEPHLYDTWLSCLIETVAECDPDANEQLLIDWHKVMLVAVNHIKNGHKG